MLRQGAIALRLLKTIDFPGGTGVSLDALDLPRGGPGHHRATSRPVAKDVAANVDGDWGRGGLERYTRFIR